MCELQLGEYISHTAQLGLYYLLYYLYLFHTN